jgi:hypothetical protein
MRYCPNDDCPDFVAIGFRQDFTTRTSVCPICGTDLTEGELPAEEVDPSVAMDRPSFDSPIPGILGGSPTGSIQPGESETLCQSCAAPVELDVQFCENCEQLPEETESEQGFAYRFLNSIRSWLVGDR